MADILLAPDLDYDNVLDEDKGFAIIADRLNINARYPGLENAINELYRDLNFQSVNSQERLAAYALKLKQNNSYESKESKESKIPEKGV